MALSLLEAFVRTRRRRRHEKGHNLETAFQGGHSSLTTISAEDAEISKRALMKLLNEDLRSKELQSYKEFVGRDVDQNKIEVSLALHRAHLVPEPVYDGQALHYRSTTASTS